MALTKNIKTDYGAAGNGTADDADNFRAFNVDGKAASGLVTLNVPTGTYLFDSGDGLSNTFANGISQFLCAGFDKETTTLKKGAQGFFLAGGGVAMAQGEGIPARIGSDWASSIQTVAAGATSVVLLTPSEHSRWHVGDAALITGIDMMGYGDPANPFFFEWVVVSAINTTTGQITFSAPLKNSYKATWPFYYDGGHGGSTGLSSYMGGPGTLYSIDQAWANTQAEYRDIALDMDTQIKPECRSIILRRVKCIQSLGVIPSQNGTIEYNNCDFSNCHIEVDKIVDTMKVIGSSFNLLFFQSASTNLVVIQGSAISDLDCTPKELQSSTTSYGNVKIGTYGYGCTDKITFNGDTIFGTFQLGGIQLFGPSDTDISTRYTMSAGVITCPGSGGPPAWAIPDRWCFWTTKSSLRTLGIFKITDIYRDTGGNIAVATNWPGGFPSLSGASVGIWCHPCPNLTVTSLSNGAGGYYFNNWPAGAPFGSYWKKTLTKSNIGNTGTQTYTDQLYGWITQISINVTAAHPGGSGSLFLNFPSAFDNYSAIKSDGSVYTFAGKIDLGVTGNRVITPTGTTTFGADSGLPNLATLGNIWMTQESGMGASADISAGSSPVSVTIEVTLNQGTSGGGSGTSRTMTCTFT